MERRNGVLELPGPEENPRQTLKQKFLVAIGLVLLTCWLCGPDRTGGNPTAKLFRFPTPVKSQDKANTLPP
jgi:hypothetical protein